MELMCKQGFKNRRWERCQRSVDSEWRNTSLAHRLTDANAMKEWVTGLPPPPLFFKQYARLLNVLHFLAILIDPGCRNCHFSFSSDQ